MANITDLTNTHWTLYFEDATSLERASTYGTYNINFVDLSNEKYNMFEIESMYEEIQTNPEDPSVVIQNYVGDICYNVKVGTSIFTSIALSWQYDNNSSNNAKWTDKNFRTIHIIDGADVQNKDLINLLYANGVLLVNEPVNKEIAYKEDVPIYTSDIINNSDFTTKKYVDDGLMYKASSSEVAKKADKTYVDSEVSKKASATELANKQDTLVSGTNIKTINDTSILGSGNIEIKGGGITPVETLPTPTKEEYDKHELYLQDVDLNYAIESVGTEPTMANVSVMIEELAGACGESANGFAYIFGGISMTTGLATSDILRFDPKTNTMKKLTTALPYAFMGGCCSRVGTKIYIFGGYDADVTFHSTILEFNSLNETIKQIPATLPKQTYGASCSTVGRFIYIFGGKTFANEQLLDTSDILEFDSGIFAITKVADLPFAMQGVRSVDMDSNIYVFLGTGMFTTPSYDALIFNTNTKSLTEITTGMPNNRTFGCAKIGENIYTFGGMGETGFSSAIYKINPSNNVANILSTTLPTATQTSICCTIENSIFGFASEGILDIFKFYIAIEYSFANLAKKTDLPTKTSNLTNDSNFTNKAYVDTQDSDLQAQINAIKGGYRSIVNTKAALDSLDKSKYNTNDIVKVISDETRNNTSTYYQLSFSKGWTYIATDTDKGTIVTVGGVEQASWSADNKVDKVSGKGLSTNDYTNDDKLQVAHIADKADKATTYSKTETDSAIASAIGTALITEV